ncbi:low affinity iron permease family protein [Caulobacter sp. RL271]|uniref:Low affinity iron permease family protein n=1 Tax=Caulobacter segnis TaxID=88688 RepID=A0ABY4ZYN6_9CAUL|nr:low affinity iron permease family protein [Caulobacter segnis]USQ97319.1 low affinity iron permease family protein [Caulobacter segnis]
MDKLFAKFANVTAKITGSPPAFLACVALVVVWAVSGPIFKFSETWQLVINTGTTIITFLMVFLIQNTQNRDGIALQTKLDELIRATTDAENEFIGIEKLTDKELEAMHAHCKARADRSVRALQRAAAEKDARVAKQAKTGKPVAADKKQPSARAQASRRAKALRAGHPN